MLNRAAATAIDTRPKASRFLEAALLYTLIVHLLAMASMLLLLRGLPGGLNIDMTKRAAYVAEHPWLWRIGWFPWQLTALSDLLIGFALVSTRWICKVPAIFATLVTLVAMVPDQTGQMAWMWVGPSVAARAVATSDFAPYGAFESLAFLHVAGWATVGYIAGALGWMWSFIAAGIWSKRLTLISCIMFPIFIAATSAVFLPPELSHLRWVGGVVGIGNGVAFVLLMVWLFEIAERVFLRSRPVATTGRYARFHYPRRGLFGMMIDFLANSRVMQAFCQFIPMLPMDSDITDVIYVNYLVEAARLEHLVDAPLQLQRLGPGGRYALFTFLTYRHGHFGPTCFGPVRKLWRSPLQSNWRIYVIDPLTQMRGVQFLAIAIDSTPYAIVARLLAENVPMHVPAAAQFNRDGDQFTLRIEPGAGTAPDVLATFRASTEPTLAGTWNECFPDWQAMLAYCVPQDRAMSVQPWAGRLTCQEIRLDIPLQACKPMSATVESAAADAIAGDALPLCFLVERVSFRLLRERHEMKE